MADQEQQQEEENQEVSYCKKDLLIEIPDFPLPQNSMTTLCSSNYHHNLVHLFVIDMKTKRKNSKGNFTSQRKPTFILSVDKFDILVGTEGGIIEHWRIEQQDFTCTMKASV